MNKRPPKINSQQEENSLCIPQQETYGVLYWLWRGTKAIFGIIRKIMTFILDIFVGFFDGLFRLHSVNNHSILSLKIGWYIGKIVNLLWHAICYIMGVIVIYLMALSFFKTIAGFFKEKRD